MTKSSKTPSVVQRDATATAGDLSSSPKLQELALLRLPAVLAKYPVSRSHWLAGVRSGKYPAPVRLSERCVAWKASAIQSLIDSL